MSWHTVSLWVWARAPTLSHWLCSLPFSSSKSWLAPQNYGSWFMTQNYGPWLGLWLWLVWSWLFFIWVRCGRVRYSSTTQLQPTTATMTLTLWLWLDWLDYDYDYDYYSDYESIVFYVFWCFLLLGSGVERGMYVCNMLSYTCCSVLRNSCCSSQWILQYPAVQSVWSLWLPLSQTASLTPIPWVTVSLFNGHQHSEDHCGNKLQLHWHTLTPMPETCLFGATDSVKFSIETSLPSL